MSQRLAQLDVRIAQLNAQRAAAARREVRERTRTTNRRKYLLGAYVLSTAGGEVANFPAEMLAALDAWAVRPRDRAALGFVAPADERTK